MVERALDTKVEAVFSGLMKARSGPIVSAEKAREIVERRKRMLSVYTRPEIPAELKKEFESAIGWTESSDTFASSIIELARSIGTSGNRPAKDMFFGARAYLDSVRLVEGADQTFADEIKKLRDRALLALLEGQNDPTRAEESVSDTLEEELKDLSDIDKGMAIQEAALIVRQVNQWRRSFEAIASIGQVALLARDILYRGLLETLGSRLERKASWEKLKKDLEDVPIEAIGFVPVVGDVAGKVKLLGEMVVHWLDKERALESEARDLAKKYADAHEFVELYSASVQAWANWAVPLSKACADMLLSINKQIAGEIVKASDGG